MEGLLVPLGFFGMIAFIVWVRAHYRALERGAADPKLLGTGDAQKRIKGLEEEKRLLESRVQNLESIVCSVDFELNQRLNRLVVEAGPPAQLAMAAPGPSMPSLDATAVASGTTLFGRYLVERELGRGGMGAV